MGLIRDKQRYELNVPNINDYFIGSKVQSSGRTINFSFEDVISVINEHIGNPSIIYTFSDTTNATLERGYFNTNLGEINFSSIVTIVINKYNSVDEDLTNFFNVIIDNKDDAVLLLKDHSSLNENYFYFKVASAEIEANYFTLNIYSVGTMYQGALVNNSDYTISLLASSLQGDGQQQSDFNELNINSPAYILNKPENTSDFINNGADGTSTYAEFDELGLVATTHDYNDLDNLPTIINQNNFVKTLWAGVYPKGMTVGSPTIQNYINTNGFTVLEDEIYVISYSAWNRGIQYLYKFLFTRGKGVYNVSSPLVSIFGETGFTFISKQRVTVDTEFDGSVETETIPLGDITGSTIENYINSLSGTSYNLEENTVYFFTTVENGNNNTYTYSGTLPKTIGDGGTPTTTNDFDLIAVNGADIYNDVIISTQQILNEGSDGTSTYVELDELELQGYLKNVVEDTTPEFGGQVDALGNNIVNLGDVTFKTGAVGGTLRTGTSVADKFELQSYDVNGGVYVKVLEVDAGNDPTLGVFADSFAIWDNTDETKRVNFTLSGGGTGAITNLAFTSTANRVVTFQDATGTVALVGDAPTAHTHPWGEITGTPTTIVGYGITDAYTKTEADGKYLLNTTDTLTGNLTVTGILNAANIEFSASNPFMLGMDNDGVLSLVGGDSVLSGAAIRLYGGSHATLANDIAFISDNVNVGYWDDSASTWNFNGAIIGASGNITGGSFIKSEGLSTQFLKADGSVDSTTYLPSSSYTAADVLSKLLTVDGSGSGLDADLLDGVDAGSFLRSDIDDITTGGSLTIGNNLRLKLSDNLEFFGNGINSYIDLINGDLLIRDNLAVTKVTVGRTTGNFTNTGNIISQGSGSNNFGSNIGGDVSLELNSAPSQFRDVIFRTNGILRWLVSTTPDVESGSNTGSNFLIRSRTDAGAVASNAFFISRNTGNVSIGNLNNTYKLDVSGTGRFTGDVTATNFILSSDERLKQNIETFDDSKHIEISVKEYELKSEPNTKRAGIIAQELEKTNPEFVRTDAEGFKSVAYIDLLIAKIAELEARLEKAGI